MSISAGFQTGDMLGFTNTLTITGSYTVATGLLTLTGSDTLANYQAALQSVTFASTSDNPPASETVTFTVNDGTIDSAPATKDIAITAVNDPPVVTTSSGTTAYTENAAGVVIDASVTASDVDSANLASATVSISSGFQAGDVLGFIDTLTDHRHLSPLDRHARPDGQ